jgi:hypothetical protein
VLFAFGDGAVLIELAVAANEDLVEASSTGSQNVETLAE